MWKFNNFLNNFTWKANLGFHPCLKASQSCSPKQPGELLSKSVKKFPNLTFYSLHFLQEMHWAKILHRRKPAYFLLFTYLQDSALDVYNSIFATTSNTLNLKSFNLSVVRNLEPLFVNINVKYGFRQLSWWYFEYIQNILSLWLFWSIQTSFLKFRLKGNGSKTNLTTVNKVLQVLRWGKYEIVRFSQIMWT